MSNEYYCLSQKLSPFEDVMTGLVPDEFRPLLGLSSLASLSSQMRHVVHAKVPQVNKQQHMLLTMICVCSPRVLA